MLGERIYVYAGNFCPPTYKDLWIVRLAAMVCPWLTVICYRGKDKKSVWFSDEECVALWNAYSLPTNVEVMTWDEFISRGLDPLRVTYVAVHDARRSEMSYGYVSPDKKQVSVFIDQSLANISALVARTAARKLELLKLRTLVAPLVVSRLLERVLRIQNLYVVVGPPRGGKTTVLELMTADGQDQVSYINTGGFYHQLQPMLEAAFPGRDLSDLALRSEEAFREVVTNPWFKLLAKALRKARQGTNVFVNVPHGMHHQVQIYRMLGGKILYVGCKDHNQLLERLTGRWEGRRRFLPLIPDGHKALEIAAQEGLRVVTVYTDCPLGELTEKVQALSQQLLT